MSVEGTGTAASPTMGEKEKIYKLGPSLFSTPERLRARFNTMYQAKYCMQLAMVARPTAADMLQYARELPQEGDRLQRVHAQSTLTGLCTAGGLVGATGWALLRTRSAPLVLASAFLGTFSSHVVGDDIASWVYGTYKFDGGRSNEEFLRWVVARRAA